MSGAPSFSAEQCRAKAAELLEAARLSPYLDQKRLYEEIAEQRLAIADELERQSH
jgi:ABC-type arginine transport system ATPase subunit